MYGAYLSGVNEVRLNARTRIEISDAIIKSKEVVFIGSDLKLDGCFLNTNQLHIESSLPLSLYKIIHFTFNKNITIPASAQGQISFGSNETNGDFIVAGAQKVEILFAPEAFEQTK